MAHRRRGVILLGVAAALTGGIAPMEAQDSTLTPLVAVLPPSVRSAGLGGAGTAVVGYAGAVFDNPSGIATIKYLSLEAAYSRLPDRSDYTMGAAAFRLAQFNFGVGYQYLRFNQPSALKDNLMWVGSGVYRFGLVALGGSGKYVSVADTGGRVHRAITTDAGLTVAVFDIMALGVSVQNIGRNVVSGLPLALPTTTRVGYSLNFVDPQSSARLLGTIEVVWTRGQERRTLVGVEAGAVFYGLGVVARAGFGGQPGGSGQPEASYGGGIVVGQLRLDYAYQSRNLLGNDVHRVGIRWTP